MRADPRHVAWLVCLPLLGCSERSSVHWASLARGTVVLAPERNLLPDGRSVDFEMRGDELWGSVQIRGDEWLATEHPDVRRAPAALLGVGRQKYRLSVNGAECGPIVTAGSGPLELGRRVEPGTFGFWRGFLYLGVPRGESAPEGLLSVRIDSGWSGSTPSVRGRRFHGRGFSVWPGQSLERVADIPPASVLSFGACLEAATALEPSGGTCRFRVRIDGEPCFERELPLTAEGTQVWSSVMLPERSHARFTFEVEGPLAYASFVDPVIGPAERGTYAKRPWPARPSIVLFLPDTLRADAVEQAMPELAAFAEQGLRYERCWSPGTFTLTGVSALFSGLYPRQTSSDARDAALPDHVETIAEILSRAGYRTGAITDSGTVSLRFGMQQGFAWFDEADLELDATLARARAFLDADDGRPVFLTVHTNRTRVPYRAPTGGKPSEAESREDWNRIAGTLRALGPPEELSTRAPERMQEVGRELEELYLRGTHELDRGFGALWRDLAARGFPAAGYVVVTSDHGEAFFEHGQAFHHGRVFEEQTRVPLVVTGPGVSPRSVHHAASLIDLAPTFAAMASAPPLPFWQGTSLLDLSRDRILFSFECADTESSSVAVLQGDRKLIALEEDRRLVAPWRAFDLKTDPEERIDLLKTAAWPGELFRNAAPVVDALLVPLVAGEGGDWEKGDLEGPSY